MWPPELNLRKARKLEPEMQGDVGGGPMGRRAAEGWGHSGSTAVREGMASAASGCAGEERVVLKVDDVGE